MQRQLMNRIQSLLGGAALVSLVSLGACSKAPAPPAENTTAAAPAAAKPAPPPRVFASKPATGTKAACAVTGEEFTVSTDTESVTHEGKTYVFCCPDCKPTFEKNPAKYAAK